MRTVKTRRVYEQKLILPVDEFLSQVNQGGKKYNPPKVFGGEEVNMHSIRYQVFKLHGTICVCCNMEGQYFSLERHRNRATNQGDKFHFNLYATNDNGHDTLMTKDHIIPSSKGGRNNMGNFQTMCTKCNKRKSDTVPN